MLKHYKGDEELARKLQKEMESQITRKVLSPSTRKENLADKELEYIDPTPDIHALFIHFDKRFFWNKLNMVEVKWSPRMTTCAGVCSYQGRNGLCSIRLSAPLLRLRPRKDLIETLLHEMIHAYLFVTDDDRDRDGHGPKFHEHMYRINREAGINISVYHDFHDEVKYYQTHWWRCDGICQKQKPYYGVVKRASNRAPGPNDFWWARHQQTCGGKFIKIKEPEKPEKTSKRKSSIPKGKDIRSFFPSPPKPNVNQIKTIKDITNGIQSRPVSSQPSGSKSKSNIHTFKSPTAGGAMTANKGGGTLVITKSNNKIKKDDTKDIQNVIKPSSSSSPHSRIVDGDVREKVRNIWTNKQFSNSQSKKPKLETSRQTNTEIITVCPVCNKNISDIDIQGHIDTCLSDSFEEEFDVNTSSVTDSQAHCPICNTEIRSSDLKEHLDDCLNNSFQSENMDFDDSDDDDDVVIVENPVEPQYPCPCCMKLVAEKSMNSHVDECLTMKALEENFDFDS